MKREEREKEKGTKEKRPVNKIQIITRLQFNSALYNNNLFCFFIYFLFLVCFFSSNVPEYDNGPG